MSSRAAPGELEVIRRFLNSERRVERLADSTTTAEWLVAHGLTEVGEAVTDDDVRVLHRLRSVLAAVVDHGAMPAIDPSIGTVEARIDVRDGRLRLTPTGPTPGMRAVALLVQSVEAADNDGSLRRLKRCNECHWAFYDNSRNRSRRWCDMAICGNRVNVQRFRERQANSPRVRAEDDQR